MHLKSLKNAFSFVVCSSLCSYFTSSLFSLASRSQFAANRDLVRPLHYPNEMFNLGSYNDNKLLSGQVTLVKDQLTNDVTYKLVVGSQITTGSLWFCADVYAGPEYKFTNHNYQDLKMMLTTDYKHHLAKYGLVKHDLKVEPFETLEDLKSVEVGMLGAPERLYTFLTVSKDIKVGEYVVLFAYGRPFTDDLPHKFKEFRVKVV